MSAVIESTLRERSVTSVPTKIREILRLRLGDRLEWRVNEDNSVTVSGRRSVPTDQAWFWSAEWQKLERQADLDIAEGRTTIFENTESFLSSFSDESS
jgi:bifunctional DNA-binding transcriptional regulator/antitoxin component of YhaV-PrlF toxin-antitoxin module